MSVYEYPPHTDHIVPLPGSGTNLSVRIWPADSPPGNLSSSSSLALAALPFILWTHGGGFLAGSHFMPLYWLDIAFRRTRGYHLISHNYRLAPQVSLEDQLADCLHILGWLRDNLPGILGEDRVDVDRYVLAGDSAGGVLVTLLGLRLPMGAVPAPRAIVDVYGAADFPAMLAMDRKEEAPAEWKGEFDARRLEAFLEDRRVENVMTDALSWDEMEQFTEEELSGYWKSEVRYMERVRLQAELHIWRSLHPRGTELMMRAVLHPEKLPGGREELEGKVREMSPLWALRGYAEEGGREYPPTAFLHGTGDEAVPWEHSQAMAEVLRGMGVPVVERYPEGEPHVFDRKYTSVDVPGWDEVIQPIVDFVVQHVEA
ncbi:putative isoprenylcysteine alpha-carbonyl methylesterase ICMEL2 [Podospora aff. communis PSN243]|uniref:Isoprenylcysteine alpha-carbonyl methylesterase ICMEL2 n=1 Tax=Podospora aff. communis PSN243 TaxID=3040156 RepID=A0AAV9G644_9PEZI|nr:putative isoprenylcysteine alpha-carbonyl methylesterase ICMEL2 [Podospora aff. communis PSN243]